MADFAKLEKLAGLIRYYSLFATTKAGSGHPTSSLSAADIGVCLFFDKLRFDLSNPQNPNNDRVIFSKGHASPLFYSLYLAAGVIDEAQIAKYRTFESELEGHPTARFKYCEAATGSLGQGLSIGVGMALSAKTDKLNFLTYVLLGDSEMAEGSCWEAVQIASYYKLGNLVAILDVNRLGQSRETMLGWDIDAYKNRLEAFGWKTMVVDGHNIEEIVGAFEQIDGKGEKPTVVIAKTIKGKGVSFLEDREGWHGKALSEADFKKAVDELGEVDFKVRGEIKKVETSAVGVQRTNAQSLNIKVDYKKGEMVATRKAFGKALASLGAENERIVSLDGETSNSTFSETFRKEFPNRYFEMFIAEQNMVGTALGMSKRGYIPFVSTFAAFFTRAFDQIRMSAYSGGNVKFVGSHSGVSIGEDGPSQMGLEDIALFKTIYGSTVFVPADAVSCEKLVAVAASDAGIFYIRTQRPDTEVIYDNNEEFVVGGSKVLKRSDNDKLTIVACGICVIEALKAAEELEKEGINVRVVDAYSVKPVDSETLRSCADAAGNLVIVVEDHYFEGGLGDSVLNVFAEDDKTRVVKLAVLKMPRSGKREELLRFEGVDAEAIRTKVRVLVKF